MNKTGPNTRSNADRCVTTAITIVFAETVPKTHKLGSFIQVRCDLPQSAIADTECMMHPFDKDMVIDSVARH